jgi:hypothetical protein
MSAPQGDGLERRLAELFEQRAATVTQARQIDLGSDDGNRKVAGSGPVRLGRHRQNLGLLAAAAAVFVAIAGTVLGIQANLHESAPPLSTGSRPLSTPTATPTATSSNNSCVTEAPASWRQAITAGAFGVDRSFNAVISANGATGEYLAIQGNEPASHSSQIYSNLEVALFHGSTGRNIFTPAHSDDFVQADPTGAISADWVAFAVAHPQNLGYSYQVMLYERSTGAVRTLVAVTDKQDGAVLGAPVIAAGKVYWLAAVFNKPETVTLDSWDLARGAAAGSMPAADATALVSYGSGVALIRTVGSQTVLSNGAGAPLAYAQLDAAAGGSNFGFDGVGKVSWLRHDGKSVGYSNLVVGGAGVSHEALIQQSVGIRPAIYPFTDVELAGAELAGSQNALLDLRTSAAVTLPAGVSLQAVVGDDVVFGTGTTKLGSAGLSVVSVSALPPVRC